MLVLENLFNRVFNIEDEEFEHLYSTGSIDKGIADIKISADNKYIIICNDDDSIRFWSIKDKKIEKTIFLPPDASSSDSLGKKIVISPNGEMVATITEEKKTKVWKTKNGELVNEFEETGCLAFSKNCEIIAIGIPGGYWGTAKLDVWSMSGQNLVATIKDFDSSFGIMFSPNAKLIASRSGFMTKIVKLWNVYEQTCIFTNFKHSNVFSELCFTSDSKILVTSTNHIFAAKSEVYFWRILDGRLLSSIKLPITKSVFFLIKKVWSLAFSQDDKILAVGAMDSLRLYGVIDDE